MGPVVPNYCLSLICERFEPRSHFKSRLNLIVRVNVTVLNRTVIVSLLLAVTDVSTTCAVVIFTVKLRLCITLVDGIVLWLLK